MKRLEQSEMGDDNIGLQCDKILKISTKNIIIDFINSNKNKVFAQLFCDEKYINGQASDFELFHQFETLLHLMVGHRIEELYRELLCKLGIPPRELSDLSLENSCNRWRMIIKDDDCHSDAEYHERENYGIYETAKAEKSLPYYQYDINGIVSKNITMCRDLKELCEAGKCPDKCEYNAYIIYSLRLDNCLYSRPDIYTANNIIHRCDSDEKYNNIVPEYLFVLLSEVLINILLSNKKGVNGTEKNKIAIRLSDRADLSCLCSLVNYLFAQKLYFGRIFVEVNADTDMEALNSLCTSVYPRIEIVPLIPAASELSVEERRRHFEKYPIGAFLSEGDKLQNELCSCVAEKV